MENKKIVNEKNDTGILEVICSGVLGLKTGDDLAGIVNADTFEYPMIAIGIIFAEKRNSFTKEELTGFINRLSFVSNGKHISDFSEEEYDIMIEVLNEMAN